MRISGRAWRYREPVLLSLAGVPHGLGFGASVNVAVQPIPPTVHSLDGAVAASVMGAKLLMEDFEELSRETIDLGGREEVLLRYVGSIPNAGRVHNLILLTTHGETIWLVTCEAVQT